MEIFYRILNLWPFFILCYMVFDISRGEGPLEYPKRQILKMLSAEEDYKYTTRDIVNLLVPHRYGPCSERQVHTSIKHLSMEGLIIIEPDCRVRLDKSVDRSKYESN